MKAIVVRAIPRGSVKPTHYAAKADGVALLIRSADSLGTQQPALTLAKCLCHKYGWSLDLVGGELPSGDEVFCFRHPGRPHV